jgi:hypothetical protein
MKETGKGDKGNKFNNMFSVYQQGHSCVVAQRFGDLLRLHHHDGCREELPAYPNDFDTAIRQPKPQAWFTDCVHRESFVLISHRIRYNILSALPIIYFEAMSEGTCLHSRMKMTWCF